MIEITEGVFVYFDDIAGIYDDVVVMVSGDIIEKIAQYTVISIERLRSDDSCHFRDIKNKATFIVY